jgi:hypothetical protein
MFCGLLQRFFSRTCAGNKLPEQPQELQLQAARTKKGLKFRMLQHGYKNPESATCTQSKSYGNGNNDFIIHCSMAFF